MGTRNLTIVQHDGQYKLAQYGQWDGYPSGQGITILSFLRNEFNRDLFINRLNSCKNLTRAEVENLFVTEKLKDEYISNSDKFDIMFKNKYPTLYRDLAGESLSYIQKSTSEVLISNSINFAADSLFCEWAYVIDLDVNMFEVYKGFNMYPLDNIDRFLFLQGSIDKTSKYYPVVLKCAWPLEKLPSDEDFLSSTGDDKVE